MVATRTGGFAIGFRRARSEWQQDLASLTRWARDSGFEALDLGPDGNRTIAAVREAGLHLGSVDLPEWQGMIDADAGKRREAVDRNVAYVEACGGVNYFAVMVPADAQRPRAENFELMIDSLGRLAPVLEDRGGRLVIEGWPGPGALCCTPEGFRALFERLPSACLGINYDPSHLIRMHIDPLRFLREFAARVHHVHAKDTLVDTEAVYTFGTTQPATFARPPAYGSTYWRYTIPGHGSMDWSGGLEILAGHGYAGCVSVELEDANFVGSAEREQLGLTLSLRYLEGC